MSDPLRTRVTAALTDAYDVGSEIGRGGMGVVYRAMDRKLRRQVAIKVLPPELAYRDDVRQRFLREAQTAAQLSHPNIVPIYAVEERDGLVCFVMALVDGESLATRIAREGKLPIEESSRILQAVADALGFAHGRGIVHRDVKPDNILLDRATGQPMVTDFGIARAAEGDMRLTVTGVAVGTPAYMSPEQAMGEAEIDGRSDLYSLAVVGFQMLTGALPFRAANTPAMMMKHISEAPPPLQQGRADVPAWFAGILECALAKKPADRFSSATAFRDALANRVLVGGQHPKPENAGDLRASSAWKHAVPVDAVAAASAAPRPAPGAALERPVRDPSRSAVDAANAGWRHQPLTPRQPAADPALPPVPPWMPDSWRDARRQWHRDRQLQGRRRGSADEQLPIEHRIRLFRRRAANNVITVGVLATINLVFSPDFLWFLFPAVGIGIGLLRQLSGLFADGLKFEDIYGAKARARLAAAAEGSARLSAGTAVAEPAALAPPEVLAGPHGAMVRRAAEDKQMIREAVAKLGKADRELIPDVLPTVDALGERVGSLALALHRIDEDVRPGTIEEIERRIAITREQPESREREQRLQLLERQVTTMKDLLSRRDGMVSQMENAALMLQSMRVDLVALRSAGVQSAMNDVNHATQEARALSREIANVLDAARQVR